MTRSLKLVFRVVLSACCAAGCSPGDTSDTTDEDAGADGGGGTPATDIALAASDAVLGVVAEDPRLAEQSPLEPADYDALAQKIALLPMVQAVDYAGDSLGTIHVKVKDGGLLLWRHITHELNESLPEDVEFTTIRDPVYHQGWEDPEDGMNLMDLPLGAYATHFPVATNNPDPQFTADDAVAGCPSEGKIAIVDFLDAEARLPDKEGVPWYPDIYNVNGQLLWERVKRMGEAAGFHVDYFKNDDINLGNYTKLADYTFVITHGHGTRPGHATAKALGASMPSILTPDPYDGDKATADGRTYREAWKTGHISVNTKTKTVNWFPTLLKDHYKPAVPQHWLVNQCFAMLPIEIGLDKDNFWKWVQKPTMPVYNFGHALTGNGVKVAFGYATVGQPSVVVQNTMRFFRREFGGYSHRDPPPPPHTYWPLCMTVQTFFRNSYTPATASYSPKLTQVSLYTMYTESTTDYFREACNTDAPNKHALLQTFMLQVGTPATALQTCWDTWWSKGEDPSGIQDALCSQGMYPTTQQEVTNAGCNIKVARKATNAILYP